MKHAFIESRAKAESENQYIASRLFARLRTQVPNYEWDSACPPFHSSYDNWHVWGYQRRTKAPSRSSSSSPSSPTITSGFEKQLSRLTLHDVSSPPTSQDRSDLFEYKRVVARVSRHALRLEREYRIALKVYNESSPTGRQCFAKPLQLIKLPPRQPRDVSLVAMIVEAPGANYLDELVEFGPNSYPYRSASENDPNSPGSASPPSFRRRRNISTDRQKTSLADFFDFAIGAARVLSVLHQGHGIVHGDLRGDAFHFNKDTGQVRLINFGSGIRAFENGLTSAGWSSFTAQLDVKHKLQFIAPEQTGRLPAEPDRRTDVYSLGILFWTMLTDQPAFAGTTPLEIMQSCLTRRLVPVDTLRPDVPEAIARIITKMTQRSMSKRYQSAAGLEHDLVACKELLINGQKLESFTLGRHDVSSAFDLPNTIIGRQEELDLLYSVINKTSALIKSTFGSHAANSASPVSSVEKSETHEETVVSDSIASFELEKSSSLGQPTKISPSDPDKRQQDQSSPKPLAIANKSQTSFDGNLTTAASVDSIVRNTSTVASNSTNGSLLRAAQRMRQNGMGQTVTISGRTGLGKSYLLQRLQSHARGKGFYASVKCYQFRKRPFEASVKLMSSLFRQIFAELDIRTELHDKLRALVYPIWQSLSPVLELPPWLLASSLGSLNSSAARSPPLNSALPTSSPRATTSKPASSTDWLYTGSGNHDRRLVCTFLDILRVISLRTLVCLCFDDIHHIDEETDLAFVNAIIAAGVPIVLIATFTSPDALVHNIKTALHPAINIDLKPFTAEQTAEYISKTIHRSQSAIAPLVTAFQQHTGGNPFSIRDMLHSCNRNGLIYFSGTSSQWEYDLAKIIELFSNSSQEHCDLTLRFAELTPESRSLLAWASLIGTSFSFSLIKHVLACDCSKASPSHLIPLRTEDPVSALQSAIGVHAIMPSDEEDGFRFSHERYHIAARELRKAYSEEEMHFVVTNALMKHEPWSEERSFKSLFDQANHIVQATEVIRQRALMKPYRLLLIKAAELARLQGSSRMSLDFLQSALRLLPDDRWKSLPGGSADASPGDVLNLMLSTAVAHWHIGQYDLAAALISDILAHNSSPADRSSALILESRIHVRKGDSHAASKSLTTALKDLGHEIKSTTWEDCDAAFWDLLPRLKAQEASLENCIGEDFAPHLLVTGAVFVEILSAAFWSDSLLFYQLTLQLLEVYLSSGPFPQVSLGYIHLACIALARHDLIAEGIAMGALAKRVISKLGNEPFTCGRGLTIHALFLGHLESNVRDQLPVILEANKHTQIAGDTLLSLLNAGALSCYRLWTAPDLAAVEAFIDEQMVRFPDSQKDMRGGVFLISIRQNTRALLGKTNTKVAACIFDDDSHCTAEFIEHIKQTCTEPWRPLAVYECHRFVVLYRFGHVKEALKLGFTLIEPMKSLFSIRHVYYFYYYMALCLLDALRSEPDGTDRSGYLDLVRHCEHKIGIVHEFNKANFGTWLEIIHAETAELEGHHDRAIQGYEAAISNSILTGAITEEALSYELYSEFLIRRGSSRPARCMIIEAVATYRRASAVGQANYLEEKHAFTIHGTDSLATADAGTQTTDVGVMACMERIHRNDEEMVSQTSEDRTKLWLDPTSVAPTDGMLDSRVGHGQASQQTTASSSGLGLDMIDLANILESSQLLSSELHFDKLLSSLTTIIVESSGADVGGVIVNEDDVGWVVAALASRDGPLNEYDVGTPLDKHDNDLAKQITQYALRFRESLYLQNVLEDERFAIPESFHLEYPEGRAMIVIPVLHGDDTLLGAIYIEGAPMSFTERNTAVLRLLVNQISISITNALLFKKLTKASASHVGMVEVQRKALAQARKSEAKAKAAEAQAMDMVRQKDEASKSRDMFLANVSHELRTPLNGVIGLSELLKGSPLNKEQEGFADSIRVCADTLLTVINDILDFSKLEAGQMQMFDVELSLTETISEVVRALSYTNHERGIETIENLELNPNMIVMADAIRIHQVFMNLLSNAFKFTAKGTVSVKASVEWEDEHMVQVLCSVSDTGIGISEAQAKKLFLPFSQADSSTARSYGGTGLGLSICKAIVEKMKGRIWLESTVGEGTTVAFRIPFQKVGKAQAAEQRLGPRSDPMAMFTNMSRTDPQQRTEAGGAVRGANLTAMPRDQIRVCVAEDNMINQKIAISFVKKLGFKCEAFNDGQQAVDALERAASSGSEPFHIVLMDVQMPVLDGLRATEKIRAHSDPRVSGVLVIAMTASAIPGDREKCLTAGMDDYLAKPVRVHVLEQKLESYVGSAGGK